MRAAVSRGGGAVLTLIKAPEHLPDGGSTLEVALHPVIEKRTISNGAFPGFRGSSTSAR